MENVECLQLWKSIAYPFLSIFEVNCYELHPVTDATTGWFMHVVSKSLDQTCDVCPLSSVVTDWEDRIKAKLILNSSLLFLRLL